MVLQDCLQTFLDDAASKKPTPGGGSVSALVGALGVSMASMAANLTISKKRYAHVEGKLTEARDRFEGARNALTDLIKVDIEAYTNVMAAYRLAKSTEAEKAVRSEAIQQALVGAMDVPLQAMRCSMDVLRDLAGIVDSVSPNVISDAGVAAILCEAVVRASKLNVDINLSGLKDSNKLGEVAAEVEQSIEAAARLAREVVAKVEASINS